MWAIWSGQAQGEAADFELSGPTTRPLSSHVAQSVAPEGIRRQLHPGVNAFGVEALPVRLGSDAFHPIVGFDLRVEISQFFVFSDFPGSPRRLLTYVSL